MNTRLRFIGEIHDDYEITEFTRVGQYLYTIAQKSEVVNFLETGSSTGGSSRCIATGLHDSSGKLYTFEASRERFESLKKNLINLPVFAFNESTVSCEEEINAYYKSDGKFAKCSNSFEKLLRKIQFDACFLDSTFLTQSTECRMAAQSKIKHIIMHEPDHKCPGYDTFLSESGYQLIEASRDEIDRSRGRRLEIHTQPLWVHYMYTKFPEKGCL